VTKLLDSQINEDFFCLAHNSIPGNCFQFADDGLTHHDGCTNLRHKWPTPEQFREEWGEDYPDDSAVYFFDITDDDGVVFPDWQIGKYKYYKKLPPYALVVCACTPWGKPPANWRPA